jgi:hypothetical protein
MGRRRGDPLPRLVRRWNLLGAECPLRSRGFERCNEVGYRQPKICGARLCQAPVAVSSPSGLGRRWGGAEAARYNGSFGDATSGSTARPVATSGEALRLASHLSSKQGFECSRAIFSGEHTRPACGARRPAGHGFPARRRKLQRWDSPGRMRSPEHHGRNFRVGCQAGALAAEASPKTALRRRAALGA